MRKNGFTVTEVLITLTIIGVVAALTMPTLVSSNKNKVNAKTLSVAISDFENGTAAAMMHDGVATLSETEAWSKTIVRGTSNSILLEASSKIGKYCKISFDSNNSNSSVFYSGQTLKNVNNSTYSISGIFDMAVPFSSKKGYTYFIYKTTPDEKYTNELDAINAGTALTSRTGFVMIDTNGKQKPNRIGYDIFAFALGDDGKLYPFGGTDFAAYDQDDKDATWDKNSSTYACTDTNKKSPGFGCTARVIDKGFEIDY